MDYALHLRGQLYPITRRGLVIGRATAADIVLSNNLVSRQHCSVRRERNRLFISDLQSQQGTFVNGVRLPPGEHPLEPGDRIEVGQIELLVLDFEQEAKDAPPDLSRLLRPQDETTSIRRLAPTYGLPNLAPLLRPRDESLSFRRFEGAQRKAPRSAPPPKVEPEASVQRPLDWLYFRGRHPAMHKVAPAPRVPNLAPMRLAASDETRSLQGMAKSDSARRADVLPDLSALCRPREESPTPFR
jgi:hypothetical protein